MVSTLCNSLVRDDLADVAAHKGSRGQVTAAAHAPALLCRHLEHLKGVADAVGHDVVVLHDNNNTSFGVSCDNLRHMP